jgi:site-specific recombinase XerD
MHHDMPPSDLRKLLNESSNVDVLRREDAVWRAMLESWAAQQKSRGLVPATISARLSMLRRFGDYTGTYPWEWRASDVEGFTGLFTAAKRSTSTIRQVHVALKVFCEYVTSPHYDWMSLCEETFGASPTQICHTWNTTSHVNDYEGRPGRRPFTYDELQRFLDEADARVATAADNGRKGALAALRDAQLFKTVYAFGLRRAEACGLDTADLLHNATLPQWGRYAGLHVRWGKSSAGGTPKRRTVMLVPEHEWWIAGMRQWVETARELFVPGDLSAMWVTERNTRVSLGYVDSRFASVRDSAGLDPYLSLHSLRHSYVTHLIEYGYAERFVQEQVGHQHASTTSIYASVSGDYKNRVLSAAFARLSGTES